MKRLEIKKLDNNTYSINRNENELSIRNIENFFNMYISSKNCRDIQQRSMNCYGTSYIRINLLDTHITFIIKLSMFPTNFDYVYVSDLRLDCNQRTYDLIKSKKWAKKANVRFS